MRKLYFLVPLWWLATVGAVFAQNITAVEYFIDEDPGIGQATKLPDITPAKEISLDLNIPLEDVSNGFHQIWFRAQSSTGEWSFVARQFFIKTSGKLKPNIDRLAYYYYSFEEEVFLPNNTDFYFYEILEEEKGKDVSLSISLNNELLKNGQRYRLFIVAATENSVPSTIEELDFTYRETVPIEIGSVETTPTSCFGAADGQIVATATGGEGTLQYSIDNQNFSESGTFTGLAAGTYTIYIKGDTPDYTVSRTVEVGSPTELQLTVSSQQELSCPEDTSGSVQLLAGGGTSPYQYRLGSGTLQSSNRFEGLAAGSYEFAVQDANGCTATVSVALQSANPLPTVPTISIEGDPVTATELSLVSSVATGVQWLKDGQPIAGANGASLPITEAGSYQVIYTDPTTGCSATSEAVSITATEEIALTTKIEVWPNPFEEVVQLAVPETVEKLEVRLFDVTGKTVLRQSFDRANLSGSSVRLETGNLPAGVYSLVAESTEGVWRKQLVKTQP